MPYTVVREHVGNYARWRRAFEEHSGSRKEAGSRGGHIFRSSEDRDEVVVFLAWEDLDRARQYLDSEAVREEREAGEVDGDPDVLYLEELGRPAS
ncbi:MAG: antibiotic biosynthesis monooxygenase [Candidatus Palauibacterales bacterium]|nr:antibiotic biosynthesis monooxygenase [Candidatus Palauibacterales bacterium]MDP2529259.1 antibiotic biosynthesis monooxygenase [Candidatus Palauibacterales bacterium]MDP2584648.1 antibiotic biosynthesis monooxygenase [Candidatus Palauibacterales bacterium]